MNTQAHSLKPAIRFWVSPRLSGSKVHNGMLPILTGTRSGYIVAGAWAKSQARFETRQGKRRNSRHQSGFFIVAAVQYPQFMTGWKGYFRVGRFPFTPVVSTLPVCHQSSLRPWVTVSNCKRNLSYDCLSTGRFTRKQPPLICPFCSKPPDPNREQLPRSPEACRPAECCHCCQLPS